MPGKPNLIALALPNSLEVICAACKFNFLSSASLSDSLKKIAAYLIVRLRTRYYLMISICNLRMLGKPDILHM